MARRIATDCSCSGGQKANGAQLPKHIIDCDEVASFSACCLPSGFPFLMCVASLSLVWRFLPKCLLASSLVIQTRRFRSLFVTLSSSTSVSRQRFYEYSTPSAISGSLLNATFQVASPPPTCVALVCKHLCCFRCFLRACACVSVICRLCLLRRVHLRCLCKYSCAGFVPLRYL